MRQRCSRDAVRVAAILAIALTAGVAQAGDPEVAACKVPPEAGPPPEAAGDRAFWDTDVARELPARALRPADVRAVLASLESQPPVTKSWWQRMLDRINAWLGREAAQSDLRWLRELLEAIPPWAPALFLQLSLAALVIVLGAVVLLELRAANLTGRRRARRRAAEGADAAPAPLAPAARERALADIAALPLAEQPGALLRLAIRALAAREAVPADASLTNRELLAILAAREPAAVPPFRQLATGAEAAVYGVIVPRAEDVTALRESLDRLAPGIA